MIGKKIIRATPLNSILFLWYERFYRIIYLATNIYSDIQKVFTDKIWKYGSVQSVASCMTSVSKKMNIPLIVT